MKNYLCIAIFAISPYTFAEDLDGNMIDDSYKVLDMMYTMGMEQQVEKAEAIAENLYLTPDVDAAVDEAIAEREEAYYDME